MSPSYFIGINNLFVAQQTSSHQPSLAESVSRPMAMPPVSQVYKHEHPVPPLDQVGCGTVCQPFNTGGCEEAKGHLIFNFLSRGPENR